MNNVAFHRRTLRLPKKPHHFGYSAQEGFPQISVGASDASSGGAVTWITNALQNSGWWATASEDDKTAIKSAGGTYTMGLFEAIKHFQAWAKIDVDGIAGPQTYGKLGYAKAEEKIDAPSKRGVSFGRDAWWSSTWVMPAAGVTALAAGVGAYFYLTRSKS